MVVATFLNFLIPREVLAKENLMTCGNESGPVLFEMFRESASTTLARATLREGFYSADLVCKKGGSECIGYWIQNNEFIRVAASKQNADAKIQFQSALNNQMREFDCTTQAPALSDLVKKDALEIEAIATFISTNSHMHPLTSDREMSALYKVDSSISSQSRYVLEFGKSNSGVCDAIDLIVQKKPSTGKYIAQQPGLLMAPPLCRLWQ
jgi:hypothetical protein